MLAIFCSVNGKENVDDLSAHIIQTQKIYLAIYILLSFIEILKEPLIFHHRN